MEEIKADYFRYHTGLGVVIKSPVGTGPDCVILSVEGINGTGWLDLMNDVGYKIIARQLNAEGQDDGNGEVVGFEIYYDPRLGTVHSLTKVSTMKAVFVPAE